MTFLFYDDSPVFGGHEVMSLLGVEALLQDDSHAVRFIATASNVTLLDKLGQIKTRFPALETETTANHSSKLEALKNRFASGGVAALAKRFSELRPDLVIAVQGNIEHSSLAILAANKAKLKVASYIPVPHSHAEMGAKLGGIRDLFTGYLFKAPDAFVTISDEMAAMLRTRGVVCPIKIVYNGVDTTRFASRNKVEARAALGIPTGAAVFGMVGRVELKQKQQHLLVQAVASDPGLREKCHLVFAGDGPDSAALSAKIEAAGLAAKVTRLPWCDPASLYPALDALIIPSRYEGLPLVMLE
ncbi:MAG: glycosyl transferase group 1, partial [Akkermansiaceae bacterium]|nr:glycosyl transferase group 1 [Akkermansiaceae bacterium]